MKVLITGGAGFIGSYLANAFTSEKVVTVDVRPYPKKKNHFVFDLTDRNSTWYFLQKISPDVIIHCAAIKNLLRCETNKELAIKTNIDATKILAEYAKNNNVFLVYLSSDQVFDGKKGNYKEDDKPNPLNVYGFTKLGSEIAIQETTDNFAICRTAMVYGDFPEHLKDHVIQEISREKFEGADQSLFPQWVIKKLNENREISVYIDRFCTPTYIGDLVDIILSIIKKGKKGLFHIAGYERVNRYEYAQIIAEIWGFDKDLIKPVTYAEPVERPADCSLCIDKIRRELQANPKSLRNGLRELKSKYNVM